MPTPGISPRPEIRRCRPRPAHVPLTAAAKLRLVSGWPAAVRCCRAGALRGAAVSGAGAVLQAVAEPDTSPRADRRWYRSAGYCNMDRGAGVTRPGCGHGARLELHSAVVLRRAGGGGAAVGQGPAEHSGFGHLNLPVGHRLGGGVLCTGSRAPQGTFGVRERRRCRRCTGSAEPGPPGSCPGQPSACGSGSCRRG